MFAISGPADVQQPKKSRMLGWLGLILLKWMQRQIKQLLPMTDSDTVTTAPATEEDIVGCSRVLAEERTPSKIEQARNGSGMANKFQHVCERFNNPDCPDDDRRKIFGSMDVLLNQLLRNTDSPSLIARGKASARAGHIVQSYVPQVKRHKTALQRGHEQSSKRIRPVDVLTTAKTDKSVQEAGPCTRFERTSQKVRAKARKKPKKFSDRSSQFEKKLLGQENVAVVEEQCVLNKSIAQAGVVHVSVDKMMEDAECDSLSLANTGEPLSSARPTLQPIVHNDCATPDERHIDVDDMVFL